MCIPLTLTIRSMQISRLQDGYKDCKMVTKTARWLQGLQDGYKDCKMVTIVTILQSNNAKSIIKKRNFFMYILEARGSSRLNDPKRVEYKKVA